MAPIKIEVTGQSKIYSPAELAVLSIGVRHDGTDKDSVVQSVVNASAELGTILTDFAKRTPAEQTAKDAAIEWSNSSLSTGSYMQWANSSAGERTYDAHMNYRVSFRDFSVLGDFAGQILSMPVVDISDIKWELSQATIDRLGTQSRHEAIRDALRKAGDYADAVGIKGLEVTSITDVPSQQQHASPFAMRAAGGGGNEGPSVKFDPEKVATECTVTVILEKQ